MKARLTGHDTFPLRYGWLYKAVNYIKNNGLLSSADNFHAADAVSALGVGKNMINAMKYWCESATLTRSTTLEGKLTQSVTALGVFLFDATDGRDPFLEKTGSVWLLHFLLNFDDEGLTAYRYFFNYSNVLVFEKSKLTDDLFLDVSRLAGTSKVNLNTVKKDVDCFLNTYSARPEVKNLKKIAKVTEDSFQSPLCELNLIADVGRGLYRAEPAERPTLPLSIFMYALARFHLDRHGDSGVAQVTFEELLSWPKSPGRIFRLSESALGQMLDEAVACYPTKVQWIDSLGLKQVVINQDLLSDPTLLLEEYYEGAQQ